MTGICGLIVSDERPDASDDFNGMLDALSRFRHGSVECGKYGRAHLGRVGYSATLSRGSCQQPFHHAGWQFVSEVRLDSRDDAIAAMQLSTSQAIHLFDEQLIAHGITMRGPDSIGNLFGDWVMAGWQATEQRLLLVREPYGYKPLYYTHNDTMFAFASNINALLGLPGVAASVDELAVARSLTRWNSGGHGTVFNNIRFLPPGHYLQWKDARLSIHRYWEMENAFVPLAIHPDDAVEEMRRMMTQSVAARTSEKTTTASMLSSGLDSSSVTVLASRSLQGVDRALNAYCAKPRYPAAVLVPPGRFGDESQLARDIAETLPNVRFHTVDAADISPIQGIERTVDAIAQPFYATSNDFWMHGLFEQVAMDGNETVLHGGMGNVTFSWGQTRAQSPWRLLAQGHWRTMAHWARWHQPLLGVRRAMLMRRTNDRPWRAYSPINPRFAQRLGLVERMRADGHHPAFHANTFKNGLQERLAWIAPATGVGVLWDMAAQRYGLDVTDATADTRLILFTLALPESVFTGPNNTPRWLVREAARDWLPENIVENKMRGLQAADLGARLANDADQMEGLLSQLKRHPLAAELLDLDYMDDIWKSVLHHNSLVNQQAAWSILLNGLCTGVFLLRHS